MRCRAISSWPAGHWPQLADDLSTPSSAENELVTFYPTRSAVSYSFWVELIEGVQERMHVLVFSGTFLVEQHNILPLVRKKSAEGVRFCFLIGDETSSAVMQRAREEGIVGGLAVSFPITGRFSDRLRLRTLLLALLVVADHDVGDACVEAGRGWGIAPPVRCSPLNPACGGCRSRRSLADGPTGVRDFANVGWALH